MTGLLLKDVLNLKKTIKQMLLILIVFVAMGFMMKSPQYVAFMLVLLGTTLVLSTMSFDEYSKWEGYALSMPVSRKDMVSSKYAFLLITMAAAFVLSVAATWIMSMFTPVNIGENILVISSAVSFMIFVYSIVLPLSFKYGVEKSRIWMLLAFGIPFVSGFLVIKYAAGHPEFAAMLPTEAQIEKMLAFAPLAALVILVISFRIAVSIYQKKEF